jgi:hypothetical protein
MGKYKTVDWMAQLPSPNQRAILTHMSKGCSVYRFVRYHKKEQLNFNSVAVHCCTCGCYITHSRPGKYIKLMMGFYEGGHG